MAPSLSRWLKNVQSTLLGTRRNRPRGVSRPPRSTRLGMESLEDRSVPAVHTWTDLGATGLWSDPAEWDAAGVPGAVPGETNIVVVFPTSDPSTTQDIVGLVVNRIDFTSPNNTITLATPLGLDGSSGNQITNTGGNNAITGSTINLSGNTAFLFVSAGTVTISSQIAGNQGIRKTGGGTLDFTQTAANTYTGPTTVADGTLLLDTFTADAGLSSAITVGDGTGAAGSAVLQLAHGNEIPNTASITVAGDGLLDVTAVALEDITTLNVNGGHVNLVAGGTLAIQSGGTVTGNGAIGSQITGAGHFRLQGGTVTFNIANGAAASDLVVSAPITQLGVANLTKTGAGTLEFAQAAPGNTYTGTTSIADGVLLLNTNTTDDGLSGTVVVGNGTGAAGSAVLRLPNATEIPDAASVTVNTDGLLDVTGTGFEDILNLNLNGGQVGIAGGGTLALFGGGTVTADGTPGSQITGAGNFRLPLGSTTFNVADGGAQTDLLVGTPITQLGVANLTKAGNGVLTLGGSNAYTGTTTVNAGTLEVTNAISGGASVNAGTLVVTGSAGGVSITGGTLAGGGTVGAVTGIAAKIAPGLGASTQTLSVGDLALNGSSFRPVLSGTASDRLNVTGTLHLTNTSLDPTVIGTLPAGASYTLISNDGTDGIGTFKGLPQGAIVALGGQSFVLSYTGGDGNDVTLTPPAYTGAFMFGNFLILLGTSFPGGFAFLAMPGGTGAVFADVTGDGWGDVVMFLPTLALAVDGATGRFTLLSSDLNGDGFRELQIFNPNGTTTTIDGKTGTMVTV